MFSRQVYTFIKIWLEILMLIGFGLVGRYTPLVYTFVNWRGIQINKSESRIQSEIILEVNKRGHRLWRANAGRVQDARTGTWIKLLPKGYADTFGIRADGKAIFIEVKNDKGKLRPEQINFRDAMLKFPVIYGVARSAEEAVEIIENGAKYYE